MSSVVERSTRYLFRSLGHVAHHWTPGRPSPLLVSFPQNGLALKIPGELAPRALVASSLISSQVPDWISFPWMSGSPSDVSFPRGLRVFLEILPTAPALILFDTVKMCVCVFFFIFSSENCPQIPHTPSYWPHATQNLKRMSHSLIFTPQSLHLIIYIIPSPITYSHTTPTSPT